MKKVNIILVLTLIVLFTGYKIINETPPKKDSIRIMAGAGMTDAFRAIKQEFEKTYPETEIELNFAGSQHLAHQIQHGVYCDVFASANRKYMDLLKSENLVDTSQILAYNTLIIGISGKSDNINKLDDLINDKTRISIAEKAVPVGNYTYQMLDKIDASKNFAPDFRERFLNNVISRELTVKGIVIKIVLGEVDAGIIYKTEINPNTRDKIIPVEIDEKYNIKAEFSIAVLKNSTKKEAAQKFINFVSGEKGRKILKEFGFILPDE